MYIQPSHGMLFPIQIFACIACLALEKLWIGSFGNQYTARKELVEVNGRERWKKISAGAIALAMMGAIHMGLPPYTAYAMGQVRMADDTMRVVIRQIYEDKRNNTAAYVEIPYVEGGSAALNNAIQTYAESVIAEYQEVVRTMGAYGHYDVYLKCSVATDHDRMFALRFDKELIMGDGMQSARIFNVDKATGEMLTLGNLFLPGSDYLTLLTRNIQKQLQQRMEEDEGSVYWIDSEITSWNFTQLREDATFYINANGQLVIVFDEGEIAPMYMGLVEVTIPTEAISNIVLLDYFS